VRLAVAAWLYLRTNDSSSAHRPQGGLVLQPITREKCQAHEKQVESENLEPNIGISNGHWNRLGFHFTLFRLI
jgi:hypothetical protein